MTRQEYKVYITPKSNTYTYGSEVEVSDYVKIDGLGIIRSQIDAQDYNVGIFNYSDLDLKCQNVNGLFNEESDLRSIFRFTRDQAKVRIVFSQTSLNTSTGTMITETIVFRGLINEEASKFNTKDDTVSFKVLSRDSVVRNTQVAAGLVTDGMTVKAAIVAIMNQVAISAVLTTTSGNVNPDLNFQIDDGTQFDSISCKDALNELLMSSNSVMLIDDNGIVTVKDRSIDDTRPILNLYGPYDSQRRQNVIDMVDYNTGHQRMYNSWRVNTEFKDNAGYAQQFGFRQKEVDLAFVTSSTTAGAIAANLLDEFKFPKLECQIEVPIYVAQSVRLLDRISLNWPLLVRPYSGKFFPIIGITKIGDDMEPLPNRLGSVDVSPNVSWKIIQIDENPQKFTKLLKLRQDGKDIDDGYFTIPGSSLVGFAVIGDGVIGGTGTVSYNPSVVGAAVIGNTQIA